MKEDCFPFNFEFKASSCEETKTGPLCLQPSYQKKRHKKAQERAQVYIHERQTDRQRHTERQRITENYGEERAKRWYHGGDRSSGSRPSFLNCSSPPPPPFPKQATTLLQR